MPVSKFTCGALLAMMGWCAQIGYSQSPRSNDDPTWQHAQALTKASAALIAQSQQLRLENTTNLSVAETLLRKEIEAGRKDSIANQERIAAINNSLEQLVISQHELTEIQREQQFFRLSNSDELQHQVALTWQIKEAEDEWLSSVGGFVKRWVYERPLDSVEMLGDGFRRFGGQLASVPQAFFTGDFDRLSHMNPLTILTLNILAATSDLAGNTLASACSVLPVQRAFGNLVDERPNEVAPDECAVYYCQGMGTSKKDAQDIADALYAHLGIKVYLIDQETDGKPLDFLRSLASRVVPVLGLTGNEPATRKMLWVIRNQPRATFITHSMGNLLCRNAINAAATLGYGPQVHNNVSWICLAPPLIDSLEVAIKPAKYHRLMNSGDGWTQGLRPQGLPTEEGKTTGDGHSARQYVKDVQSDWLMR